ncbi:MAG: winged helix-turn-helix transcriptional regulator [Methanoregula sp.]|jgi:predicted transcriptional regulator|nr:winged helix-turn-helix transcriptional regulator [Methanoregula sp.]
MVPAAALIGKLKIATSYFFLFLFALLCIYASLNTITLFLWGDPSVLGRPRVFHPPEIMVLHYVGMISPDLARLVVTALFWGCGIFAWLGFRHITRKNSLDHPLRERIIDFIRSHPGCHFGSIVRECGINRGTLSHHLEQLTSRGLVHEVRDGGLTRYYMRVSGISELERKIQIHRDNPVRGLILTTLGQDSQIARIQLKRDLNLSGPALWYHIQLLEQDGIVISEQDSVRTGRPVQYSLTQDAGEIVRNRKEGGPAGVAGIQFHPNKIPENELPSGRDTKVRA